jgi:hypothetical protein
MATAIIGGSMHATPVHATVMKFGFPLTLEPTRTTGMVVMYGLGPKDVLSIFKSPEYLNYRYS